MNRSCVFHKFWSTFFKRLGHYLRAGTRPAPAFGRLGNYQLKELELYGVFKASKTACVSFTEIFNILYPSTRLLFYARQRNFML